ncbi:MAG: hypothetical protein U0324_21075 [Polyangiales bacterium]
MKLSGALMVCSLAAACLGEPYAVGRAPADGPPPAPVAPPPPPESAVQIAAQDYDTCVRTAGRGTFCAGLSAGGNGALRRAPLGGAANAVQRLSEHNGIGFVLADVLGAERPAMLRASEPVEELGRFLAAETGRHPDFGGVQGVAGIGADAYAWTHAGELFCAGDCRLVGPMQVNGRAALAALPAIREVALGAEHACALFASGRVECWGDNRHAQCGTADLVMAHARAPIPWAPLAASIAAGSDFSCIVKLDGDAFCWGGEGPEPVRTVLLPALRGVHNVTQLTFGALHGCALHDDGAVDCWGMGAAAGSSRPTTAPTRVPIPAARRLASGLTHTCAETTDGGVWCWGANAHGEVGAPAGEARDAAHPIALVPVRW